MAYRSGELCKRRVIKKLDISTPLLVPSFSSRGFPEAATIQRNIAAYLPAAVLISCYDLHYGLIDFDDVSNVVFLDSGGYEASPFPDIPADQPPSAAAQAWDRERYLATLRNARDLSTSIIVSYDNPGLSIIDQVNHSTADFLEFDSAATDLLLKPSNADVVDLNEVERNITSLDSFDILGVTEDELGGTIAERLRNVASLRDSLSKHGMTMPIHIFGCLDPASAWLYFLCGADIFDGLSWLRYAFTENNALYRNTWAILEGEFHLADRDLAYRSYLRNIEILGVLQRKMGRYAEAPDLSLVSMSKDVMAQAFLAAGVDLA